MAASVEAGASGASAASIGPDGGAVAGPSGALVQVPPGALLGMTPIDIQVVSAGYPSLPVDVYLVSPVFAFLPHGVTFATPVAIRVPYAGVDPSKAWLYTAPLSGTWTKVNSTIVGPDYTQADVTHFSFFANVSPRASSSGTGRSSGDGSDGAAGGAPGATGVGGGVGGVTLAGTGGAGQGGGGLGGSGNGGAAGGSAGTAGTTADASDGTTSDASGDATSSFCHPGDRICGGTEVVLECDANGSSYVSKSFCTVSDGLHTCVDGVCQCPPGMPPPCETCPRDQQCPANSTWDSVNCVCTGVGDAQQE